MNTLRPISRNSLSDAAVFAHKRLKADATFPELIRALEASAPTISLLTAEGTTDLTTTAMTAAQYRGYRMAIDNLINLTQ
jgi:hypothetical protein